METKIEYEDLKFRPGLDESIVRAEFLRNYYFDIQKESLEKISNFSLENGAILFDCSEKRARNKLNLIIDHGLNNLIHKVRNKPCLYVHENSDIPLIGSNEFGIVDRGSTILEVKPMTGCNISCIFCSVDEGKNDKTDILVEEEYLIEEFNNIASIKEHLIEVNINPQGEPLLYPKIVELIKDLKENPKVDIISINTNGLLLNPKLINDLSEAGLDRINLSIHAIDQELATKLSDGPFNVKKLLQSIKDCEGKIDVLLAPVFLPNYNEGEIDKLIELAKTIKNKKYPTIGIQNFLNYKRGRNITKQMPWENFYELLKAKEEKYGIKLILGEETFKIQPDKSPEKPFKKGNIIEAEIVANGRKKGDVLCASKNRVITVSGINKKSGKIKIKLIRDKHNIYSGVASHLAK